MESLPNEMLLSIFELLEYYDLKRLQRVCKRFNEFLNDTESSSPNIDQLLFRDTVRPAPHQQFTIHPIFDLVQFDCDGDIEFAGVKVPRVKGDYTYSIPEYPWQRVAALPAAFENAASPAVTMVYIYAVRWICVYGSGLQDAVTVLDVVKVFAQHLDPQPMDNRCPGQYCWSFQFTTRVQGRNIPVFPVEHDAGDYL